MRWSFRIGSIAGIEVRLHVTFLLFVAWGALSQGLLSGRAQEALGGVATLLAVFACVLLHELGHALAARRYGIRTRDIVLLPIGGLARLERMPDRPVQEIVVAIAGPLVNVAILILLLVVGGGPGLLFGSGPGGELGTLGTLAWVNLIMFLFNLIPAFPMDGGRVLRALLAMRLPYARATRIAATVGQVLALLLGVAGLFAKMPMLLLVALFVFLSAGEEHAMAQTRATMSGMPVRAAMLTRFAALDVRDPLQRAVDLLVAGTQQDFPVLDGGAPVGVLTRAGLLRSLQHLGPTAVVGQAVLRDGATADPQEPLAIAYQRMRVSGQEALLVVERGQLVGLLTGDAMGELLPAQGSPRAQG